MTGLWSAALWLLQLAFKIIDAFTTPDLSASGPMGAVLPTTLWIGAAVAVIMMFVQLTLALVRRDGQSLGRVLLGIGQFGAGLGRLPRRRGRRWSPPPPAWSTGILQSMLHVDALSACDLSPSRGRGRSATSPLATVLGVLSVC